jgi:hypothetical protein
MVIARNTEPRYIVRDRDTALAVQCFSPDRSTAAAIVAADLRLYLRGELVYEELGILPSPADTVSTTVTGAPPDKALGPTLEHWTIEALIGLGPTTDFTDILIDGWLVRYFPSPTLVDQDLLDLNPDLLAVAGTSITTFETFHKRAWSAILRRLFRQGRRPELNLSPSQLWDCQYHLTMSSISRYFWQTMGDERWRIEAREQFVMYDDAFNAAILQYDQGQDGTPDEGWTYPASPVVRTGRARGAR